MEKILSPSILAADFSILGAQLDMIKNAGATYVHLDVMDGLFVPSISFGMPLIQSIRRHCDLVFDVHMMVTDPERYIEAMKTAGADIVSIHVEACSDVKNTLLKIRELGMKPALAFNPETAVSDLGEYLPYVDEVVLMSVHPGFGGQSFIEASHDKLKELVQLRTGLGLNFLIEVDGGVNASNVESVLESGADIIVAGSAVFKADVEANARALLSIIKKYED